MVVENERADVGRDGQTYLTRPNSQARMGTGKTYTLLPYINTLYSISRSFPPKLNFGVMSVESSFLPV